MAAALFLGIREAKNSIKPVIDLWKEAMKEEVVKNDEEREQLLDSLFTRKLLQTPGVRTEESISSILTAWDLEPGSTRADLINAVSRVAHESVWPSLGVSEGLESQAGQLLQIKLRSI